MDRAFSPRSLRADLPASLVVFLVALPLCLGIALASGAPLMSGIVTGVVGGIVAGVVSGSHLAVSGPAAGLTVIVLAALNDLGSFSAFLVAVVLAGAMQLVLGFAGAGVVGSFIPDAVIKGMLAAIGLILILKQIPHAFGVDSDPEGNVAFFQPDGETTFSELFNLWGHVQPGAVVIAVFSILILYAWDGPLKKRHPRLGMIPGPLLAVAAGAGLNAAYVAFDPSWVLGPEHRVQLPTDGPMAMVQGLPRPDFGAIMDTQVWVVAVTVALVASLETLLSLEATDKLDPLKRIAPTNRELKAQGLGNLLAGLAGGLPMTAVIVRSSANVAAGARTKASAMLHGVWLLAAVMFAPTVMNQIPLAALAGILLMVGFKLTRPSLYRSIWARGRDQFIPFIVTISAIMLTDLLIGIGIGLAVGVAFVVKSNYHAGLSVEQQPDRTIIHLNPVVSFLNKQRLRAALEQIPDGSRVTFDGTRTRFLDNDIVDAIEDFVSSASDRNIDVEVLRPEPRTGQGSGRARLEPLVRKAARAVA